MSEYTGLLEALQKMDQEANQPLVQKVHKAGGGKEEVQMNLKKMNKDIKEAKSQRPKTKRKKVYNSPFGYKKGGVTLKKKRAAFNNGGTSKKTAQFADEAAAKAAMDKHMKNYPNKSFEATYWTTDHEGEKVVTSMSYSPKGSDKWKETQAIIRKSEHDQQIKEKRFQHLIANGMDEEQARKIAFGY